MPNYYPINEEEARRAKNANSFSDYVPGSATAAYREQVDRAAEIAANQKAKVDPMYHDRIDLLFDLYAKRLAENINKQNSIDASVPSVLIAGGSNFPVRKKEKQNARRDANMQDYMKVQEILERIKSVGKGGVMSDDPKALEKLRTKLEQLEQVQATMKAVNAYYRKHKTLDGCTELKPETLEKLKAEMSSGHWRVDDKPFASYELTNNNANIHRIRSRIEEIERNQSREAAEDITGEGYTLKEDTEAVRIQFYFDEKPSAEVREILKSHGFRWAPSVGAWQRMLNDNGRYAAKQVIERLSEVLS